MARKPAHFTTHTNEETHLRFKAVVEQLGMSVDSRDEKLHNIKIDGVRIGDRVSEMRKPGTSFYGQSYVEARAAAMLMVDLGRDQRVADVRRLEPPAPDIEVVFGDGTSVFIEQTMVMDDLAHRLSLAVDAANAAVWRAASADPALAAALDAGLLEIRLDRLTPAHLDLELPVDELTAEICAIARDSTEDVLLRRADPMTDQLLHRLGARISYRRNLKTGSAIQPPTDHGRPATLGPTLREQLRKKLRKASGYTAHCRPLWLLINIDNHFGIASFERIIRATVESEKPTSFDRTVVQQARYDTIIIDP